MIALALAPIALAITTTVRTIAYRNDRGKRVLTYVAALLACSTFLRLPFIRDHLGDALTRECGLTNLPLLASVILGSIAADQLAYYGHRLTGAIDRHRATRRALLAVAVGFLILAYAERRLFGLSTDPGVRSLLMQFAMTVLGAQFTYCVIHLVIGARAMLHQCPMRRYGVMAVSWMLAGVCGALYALVLILWPVLDLDDDGALHGIPYLTVVWLLHLPMCLALSVGCSTLALRRLLATAQPQEPI